MTRCRNQADASSHLSQRYTACPHIHKANGGLPIQSPPENAHDKMNSQMILSSELKRNRREFCLNVHP